MKVLLTGAAGFIGMHTTLRLLERAQEVIGVDNLNDYYDVNLKQARLDRLLTNPAFAFERADISDPVAMQAIADRHRDAVVVVNLAAAVGVRYSVENPAVYGKSNLLGFLNILEFARRMPECRHLVYASSSSVYGDNEEVPFSENDRVDHPVSLYAASKKANELMAHSYSHLYGIPTTGLRFFTVYGPWGRPDMAYYLFAKSIAEGQPIRIFNEGKMRRDFTFIDDIVTGVLAVIDNPPTGGGGQAPYKIYNIGNNRSEPLMRFIGLIEAALGRKAECRFEPMQLGDVKETYANIDAIAGDLGYQPTTPIDVGIPQFIEWFTRYHHIEAQLV